jgi:hypothetical protein
MFKDHPGDRATTSTAPPDGDVVDLPSLPEQWHPHPKRVKKAILSFDLEVACGPSGSSINHLKALASNDDITPDSPSIGILTEPLTCISAPQPFWSGRGIRSAPHPVIRTSSASSGRRNTRESGGDSELVHLVRCLLQADSTSCVASVDVTNAFNRISRQHMLEEKLKHFPHTARFSWACFGKSSQLYYKPSRCSDARDEAVSNPKTAISKELTMAQPTSR